jgi:hypothetical protein
MTLEVQFITFVQKSSTELEANRCPLAVALVQAAHEMHTAAAYTECLFTI